MASKAKSLASVTAAFEIACANVTTLITLFERMEGDAKSSIGDYLAICDAINDCRDYLLPRCVQDSDSASEAMLARMASLRSDASKALAARTERRNAAAQK